MRRLWQSGTFTIWHEKIKTSRMSLEIAPQGRLKIFLQVLCLQLLGSTLMKLFEIIHQYLSCCSQGFWYLRRMKVFHLGNNLHCLTFVFSVRSKFVTEGFFCQIVKKSFKKYFFLGYCLVSHFCTILLGRLRPDSKLFALKKLIKTEDYIRPTWLYILFWIEK